MKYSENIIYDNIDNKDFFNKIEAIKTYTEGKNLKYHIVTYGCQMNEHDSEQISWMLEMMGYKETNIIEEADFALFNTCAIRENAELKVYGKVGSLKTIKENKPDMKIAVAGCMMQLPNIQKEIEDKFKHVDLIFGTHNVYKLPELLLKSFKTGNRAIDVMEDSFEIIEGMENIRQSKHSAYVNIMFGCNNFCTYCVVPYTRGREVSRRPEDILNEIKTLAKEGYKEITLLGQNVNSYGKTLDLKEEYNFTNLLEDIDRIEGVERIRFMTSHPRDISDELIEAYGRLDNLSKSLHLPVQSGSNRILKAMNRHYTREKYLDSINKVKKLDESISLSTDIIIGFPGETEEDFRETLSLIEEVEYDFVYSFIYSIRPGTKAGKMDNQIDYDIKHRRFEELNEVVNRIILKKNEKLVGKTFKVLVDEISKTDESRLSGRTDSFKLVHFSGDSSLIGKIIDVKITSASTFSLEGEIVR